MIQHGPPQPSLLKESRHLVTEFSLWHMQFVWSRDALRELEDRLHAADVPVERKSAFLNALMDLARAKAVKQYIEEQEGRRDLE